MIIVKDSKRVQISGIILLCNIAVGSMICSFLIYGCAKKNYSELDARLSADWVQDAVIYEVNLHSFSKEGTFNALEKRIHELKKMGVTVVSLMPIHPVGELNRRGSLGNPYAVKDYYEIDPAFGVSNDLKSLVNSLHGQGMKIIFDIAASYAAWDSQILMEHPDWFMHDEEGAIVSPEILMPDAALLDYNQHEPKKYMIAVMKYWVKEFDIDGFKCTAAESVPIHFWNIVRKELDKIKTVIMISDFSQPEYHIKAFDLTPTWSLNDIFTSIINKTAAASVIDDSLKYEFTKFPKGSMHLRFNGAYSKIESVQLSENSNPQEAKILAVLKFMIPGVPLIYNGEETGIIKNPNSYDKVEIDWSNGKDLIELYCQLGTLHRDHPALRNGSYLSILNSENKTVYSFLRSSGEDSIITVINFGNEKKEINLKMPAGSPLMWKDQLSGQFFQVKDLSLTIMLLPLSYAILVSEFERSAK